MSIVAFCFCFLYSFFLLSFVLTVTPTPKQPPARFHALLNRANNNDDTGALILSDMGFYHYDAEAGYVCSSNVQFLPPDHPIPPAEQGSMYRFYVNATEQKRYAALLHKNGTNQCWIDGLSPAEINMFVVPEILQYGSTKLIDRVWVDDFNLTDFTWEGQHYDYMEYAQTSDGGFPLLHIKKQKEVTSRIFFVGFVPVASSAPSCDYNFVSGACQEPFCRSLREMEAGVVGGAVDWVCGQPGVNCSDINPGGEHYIPNDAWNHADWSFTKYYKIHAPQVGFQACCFAATPSDPCIAELVF